MSSSGEKQFSLEERRNYLQKHLLMFLYLDYSLERRSQELKFYMLFSVNVQLNQQLLLFYIPSLCVNMSLQSLWEIKNHFLKRVQGQTFKHRD